MGRTLLGREPGTSLWPARIKPEGGIESLMEGVGGQTKPSFGAQVGFKQANTVVEGRNRIAPFLKMLAEGMDPAEAAARVRQIQGAYNPQYYTQFERNVMGRLFPFYPFLKGQTMGVAKTLAEEPGGRMAQTIRATNRLRGEDNRPIPPYLSDTAAIPVNEETPILGSLIGGAPEGEGQRYVTGFGLMHEDPARILGPVASMLPAAASLLTPGLGLIPSTAGKIAAGTALMGAGNYVLPTGLTGEGLKELGLEMISRLNPIPKAAVEWPFGQASFQRGPAGGRPLEEMDPLLGRTVSNLLERKEPLETPSSLEYLLSASPASSIIRSIRVASDPRKGMVAKGLNLLTGMQVVDVAPVQTDRLAIEAINKRVKETGGRPFAAVSYSPQTLERMTPDQRNEAIALMKLQDAISDRQKARAKATVKEHPLPRGLSRLKYAEQLQQRQ